MCGGLKRGILAVVWEVVTINTLFYVKMGCTETGHRGAVKRCPLIEGGVDAIYHVIIRYHRFNRWHQFFQIRG